MKLQLLIALMWMASITQAQNFSKTSFSAQGFPFGMGFPAAIETSVKPSANDTLLTAYATSGSVSYVFSASKVKDKNIATRTLPGIISKLEQKAGKVSQKKTASLLGQTSTYIDYTNDKGSFISMHLLVIDRYIVQVYTLNKTAYLGAAQNDAFFNTLSMGNSNATNTSNISTNNINNNNNTNTTTNTNTAATNNGAWKLYDRAEIFDSKENKWFGCVVIKVNSNNTYRIAYDGYAETYDEDVPAERLKQPTSNTTPSNVPYIRVQKGGTVYVKGNLKKGQMMEDLEWAELSSMACWPGIRNVEFEGNHVGYWFDLPKKSIVKITVTPTSTKSRINIYGYSGFDLKKTPPEVSRCTSCEASHPTWIGEPNLSEPAKPQTIEFNTTTRHTFVYLAVAGARGVTEGDYTITITIQ